VQGRRAVSSPDSSLRKFVYAFLPFDENAVQEALAGQDDELAMGVAAVSSFVTLVRSRPIMIEDRAQRVDFCLAVTRYPFFEGNLPVWVVEAVIQSAQGSQTSSEGILPDTVAEVQVWALAEMSKRLDGTNGLSRFRTEAVDLAESLQRSLGTAESLETTD